MSLKFREIPAYYALFGEPILSELQPQALADSNAAGKGWHPDQGRQITRLRTNPTRSWLLMGSNGTGKSFLGWSLWWNAVLLGRPNAAYRLEEFVTEYRTWENSSDKDTDRPNSRPRILPWDLKTGTKHTIFIDECDKLDRVTPYVS
ncbi:MAG: hypothetical protein ACREAC_28150, partial [Blastocatellia bacterium]